MSTEPPGDDPIDVGVVVVTFNSAAVIGALLASLPAGLAGVRWQVVVADNDSHDDTAAVVADAGYDVVAVGRNAGYAAAINRGVAALPWTRSVLILNPDVELTPGCAAAMLGVLDRDPHVGVVAPKMFVGDPPTMLEPSQRRDPSLASTWATALLGAPIASRSPALFEAVTDPARYHVPQDVDWAVGAVLLCGRACVDAVGDWDESFFLYSEETDWCQRARQAGFAVRYTPSAVVHHRGGDGLVNPRAAGDDGRQQGARVPTATPRRRRLPVPRRHLGARMDARARWARGVAGSGAGAGAAAPPPTGARCRRRAAAALIVSRGRRRRRRTTGC